MMTKFIFLFSLIFISRSGHALYGARPIGSKQFGFVGSLHLKDEEVSKIDYFCSVVLVSPTRVLTAAHCIEGIGRDEYDDVYFFHNSPYFLVTKFNGKSYRVKRVKYAASYFELDGRAGEDLVMLDLVSAVTDVAPAKFYSGGFKVGQAMTLVARGKMADTKLIKALRYRSSGAVVLDTDGSQAGTCGGDSGGAMLTNVNGEWRLAGILMYDGGQRCERKNSFAYSPLGHF